MTSFFSQHGINRHTFTGLFESQHQPDPEVEMMSQCTRTSTKVSHLKHLELSDFNS